MGKKNKLQELRKRKAKLLKELDKLNEELTKLEDV